MTVADDDVLAWCAVFTKSMQEVRELLCVHAETITFSDALGTSGLGQLCPYGAIVGVLPVLQINGLGIRSRRFGRRRFGVNTSHELVHL